MAFVATSDHVTFTQLSDGGVLNNTVGLIALDKLTPLIGNRQAMMDLVESEGIDLIQQKGKGGTLSGTADVEAGTVYVAYLIRHNGLRYGSEFLHDQSNLLFDESTFNVGVNSGAVVDFFNEASPPETQSAVNVFGFEDLIEDSDMDYNDTVFRVSDAIYVDNLIV